MLESRALHKPQASEFLIESLEFSILLGKPAMAEANCSHTMVLTKGRCKVRLLCAPQWRLHETAMPSIDLCSSSIWFLSWRPFELSSKTIVKPWKCVFNVIENIHINLQNSPRTQIVQRDLGEESLRRRLIRYWAVTKTLLVGCIQGMKNYPVIYTPWN